MRDEDESDVTPVNGIDAAVKAGQRSVDLHLRSDTVDDGQDGPLRDGVDSVPLYLVDEGQKLVVPTEALDRLARERSHPPRKKGTSKHLELGSFIAHVNRYKDDRSVIWAEPQFCTLTAVLNYNAGGQVGLAQWGDHRAIYTCPLSDPWLLWLQAATQVHSQDAFAELLEMNAQDLVGPADRDAGGVAVPAQLMDMTRQLRIHSKSIFERKVNPTTGESSLNTAVENAESSTKIPAAFMLAIPVFRAGAKYRLEARLRLRMENGRPSFGFVLPTAKLALEAAFNEVRQYAVNGDAGNPDKGTSSTAGTGLPLFVGTPE